MSESNQVHSIITANTTVSTTTAITTNTTNTTPTILNPPFNPTSNAFIYPKSPKRYEFIDDDESKNVRIAKCIDNDEIVAIKRISFKKDDETIEDLMVDCCFNWFFKI